MKNSMRLQPIVRLADNRQQRAAEALGAAQRNLQSQESRLNELRRYYEEYLQQLHHIGRGGSGAATLLSIKDFTEKLHSAIQIQQQQVQDAQTVVQKHQTNWFESRKQKKTLVNVVDTINRKERKLEDEIEQKDYDERNLRNYCVKNDDVA